MRPLQFIQNAAAHLVNSLHRHSHATSLLTTLHCLLLMACIKFKTLMLASHAVKGSAQAYLRRIIKPYTSGRPLWSANTGRLVPPLPCTNSPRYWLLSVLGPSGGMTSTNSRDPDHLLAQTEDSPTQAAPLPTHRYLPVIPKRRCTSEK